MFFVWRKTKTVRGSVIVTGAHCRQQLALPIKPGELLILGAATLIKQDPGTGNREAGLIPTLVADFRDDNRAFTAEFKTPRVERLRHESTIMHEQQRGRLSAQKRRIGRARVRVQQHFGGC